MKNISKAFRDELNNDNRNFVKSCTITLADGTVLNITQSDTWQNGFSIDEAVSRFPEFLDKTLAENPVKGEFFLPTVISQLIDEGKARAKVLRSADKWYGVTYMADKPMVVAAIAEKTASGLYPDNLWEEN